MLITPPSLPRLCWLAILFVCSLVACGPPPCEDCPQLFLHFPPTSRNNPSEGALTIDFTLADKKNAMLFLAADAQIMRVGPNWQIKLAQGSGGISLTTPSYTEVTTPQGKAYALEYFRAFVPLQAQHIETLYAKGLTLKLHSLGQLFQVMHIETKAIQSQSAEQVSFQIEASLWLGKLPNQLICQQKIIPTTVKFSSEKKSPFLISWTKGCS